MSCTCGLKSLPVSFHWVPINFRVCGLKRHFYRGDGGRSSRPETEGGFLFLVSERVCVDVPGPCVRDSSGLRERGPSLTGMVTRAGHLPDRWCATARPYRELAISTNCDRRISAHKWRGFCTHGGALNPTSF
jgi:hypothetical protein